MVAVVVPNLNKSSVLNLTTFVYKEGLSSKEEIELGKNLIRHIANNMINQVNKVRLSYYALNMDDKPQFIELVKKIGFKFEAELKKEYNEYSLYMYSLDVAEIM